MPGHASARPRAARRALLAAAVVLASFTAIAAHAGTGVWTGVAPRAKNIEAIARDPLNPSRLWCATFGSGVARSLDGGATWTLYRTGLVSTFVRCLAVEPHHPDSLFCGTEDGVYLSTDGGVTWAPPSTSPSAREPVGSWVTQPAEILSGSARRN